MIRHLAKSPIVRISFGLVLLTISILLIGDIFSVSAIKVRWRPSVRANNCVNRWPFSFRCCYPSETHGRSRQRLNL